MLARTADAIFWVSRYMERADFLARIIQATQRLAGLPAVYSQSATRGKGTEWDSVLEASGAAESFRATGAVVNETNVVEFLAFSTDNASSIRNCIANARSNARSIRVALTTEMWESINGAWFELIRFEQMHLGQAGRLQREELTRFLDFVKKTSLDFDGCAYRTMLRNDSYWFSRLGVYIERADNTARILDVKYNVLLPESEVVGGTLDYFQWTAILRAVSAHTAYHWVYKQSIKPWLVADLLILKPDMPRSLIACYDNIVYFLDAIGRAYGRQGQAQRQARETYERLSNATTREIFQSGLHEFITSFVESNGRLGETIGIQYLALTAA